MSLIHIRAHFNCDGCGTQFSVGLNADYEPPSGWSLFDCAEDSVRGSLDYLDKDQSGGVASSVQNEMHLCRACTSKADEEVEVTDSNDPSDLDIDPETDPSNAMGYYCGICGVKNGEPRCGICGQDLDGPSG